LKNGEKNLVMKRYKLSTGLWEVYEKPEFENDSDAWEYLRHSLPNKFATLYREEVVLVPYNNADVYVKKYNEKYGPKPIGYGPDSAEILKADEPSKNTVWIPVLVGLTNDEYNVKQ
jgi:hypothetical protein